MEQDNLMESENDDKVIKTEPLEILKNLCRVCGKSNDKMIPIFENHEYQLADKINRYLPITVAEQDALPLRACITCVATIVQWHTLLESCIKANGKLLRILREQHQVELLDMNQSSLDRISLDPEVEENQLVKGVRIDGVQHQSSHLLPVKGENRGISGDNCSGEPGTSNQSHQINPIYENISEDEAEEDNVASEPIDMTMNPSKHSDDVEIVNDKLEPRVAKMAKLFKIQKIKDLLKKAQIKIQGKSFYHCRKCMKNFSSHVDYVYHVKSHTRPKDIANECNICGKQFHTKPHLIRHMSKHHLRTRKLICERCHKVCGSPKQFNDEPDSNTESYMCKSCKDRVNNKVVYTSATIFASITASDEDCPKQCENCKNFFPTESSLRCHVSERSCMRVSDEIQQITE
ncbi:zinc finger protein 394-like [Chelonus insularis]|uniref:zinc finger protein 394-like n=1 Tax=Chelonus insularis TaxID=460826 RepID=UPI00158CC238|nr:zinc finger protein 394-like [Chelonus insularis]